ncbi:unnamed protein product [Pipistrellus nathusii]|uniref:RING-type domain-containing protein n=1 Tax=Pipistrellus nathusii TaxID=59473 RepID=A0ABP0AKB2_PIPNA
MDKKYCFNWPAAAPTPTPVGALPWRPPQAALAPFSGGGGGGSSFSTASSLPSSSSTAAATAACAALDSSASNGGRKAAAATAASAPGVPVTPAPAAPGPALVRECVVCAEGEVMAALVPCGHNLFCLDCAVRICGKSEPECPACRMPATQAIHTFS